MGNINEQLGGGNPLRPESEILAPSCPRGASLEEERTELLVRLLSRHQEALFRYIFALLPHPEDARDALQETCVALCRKFADYDSQKPFLAWAYASPTSRCSSSGRAGGAAACC